MQVRQNALSALQSYLKILADNAAALDQAAAAAAENGDASAAATQAVRFLDLSGSGSLSCVLSRTCNSGIA